MAESKEQTNKSHLPEQESNLPVFNRRQFISFGASAAAAALAFPKAAQAYIQMPGIPQHKTRGIVQQSTPATPTTPIAPVVPTTPSSLTPPSDTSFFQPNIITSIVNGSDNYGTLSSTLEIVEQPYTPPGSGLSGTYIRMIKPVTSNKAAFRFDPGPTLCVNPGDKISLDVTNNLSVNIPPPPATGGESTYCSPNRNTNSAIPSPNAGNTPGCFNTTNLHFHGLHVSPLSLDTSGNPVSSGTVTANKIKESSDDVLYALKPGANNKYCPWLPAFHAPGTHWYHAHHHGSTALQAAEGLAGALIVKEPPGQEICQGAPDVVMIMQEEPQPITGNNGYVTKLTDQEKLDRGVYERTGRNDTGNFLINGKQNPTLNLQQGEIQRWRFINATSTPRAFSFLQLQDSSGTPVVVYRIAVDGITLYGKSMNDPSVKVTQASFAPGNRVDLLVNLQPGTYTLQKLKDGANARASQAQQLATIVVDTTPYSNADEVATSFNNLMANGIPSTGKPAYLNPIAAADVDNNNQTPVVFQAAGVTPPDQVQTTGRGDFRISNSKFDPKNLANIQANLNSTEEWIVANTLGGAAHPFHIHVNPFLVVGIATVDATTQTNINGAGSQANQYIYNQLNALTWTPTSIATNGIDPTIWWDTFTIPPGTAVKIRHRFDDYYGNYVLHCHILLHEDQGMMWAVQINDVDNKGAIPCQQLLNPILTT